MPVSSSDFLSVQEAADELSLTTGRIRQMIRASEMSAQKLGQRAWAVPRAEVDRIRNERSRPRRRAS